MKRRRGKNFFLLIVTLLMVVFFPKQVFGETTNLITMYPVLPSNQINKKLSYFDLKVKAGEKQTLELVIQNNDTKDKKVKVEINPAFTGASGNIVYNVDRKEKDESMKLSLSDIAKTDGEVDIEAGQQKTIKIQLDIPKEPFEGIILGGINVSESGNKETKNKKSNLNSKFSYSVAIQLRENDKLPEPKITLNNVYSTTEYGKNIVTLHLINPMPILMDHITYQAFVRAVGEEEVLIHKEEKDYRFAPNSSFDFKMAWNQDKIKAGRYVLNLVVKDKKNNKEWNFKEEFILTADDAKRINSESVIVKKSNSQWQLWLIIVILLILVIVIGLFYLKSKKVKRNKKSMRS